MARKVGNSTKSWLGHNFVVIGHSFVVLVQVKVFFKDYNIILKYRILCDYFGLKKTYIWISKY